ncbi:hypothetical protein [Thalassospira sp. GB04J01]|uniref:hypothetical protein n=1 Tax=Thalassospira sp. GB04J01 TaxID=1485225 RepID=UPI000C9AFBD4|nr:hypothetical protein [Thalassospira sp. GB04J01]|tara:strand:+ start:2808 stop:3584 length:777 start_codon:yes stop_codon:yes gene_type:complete
MFSIRELGTSSFNATPENLHSAAWLWAVFDCNRGWHFFDEYLYQKALQRNLTSYDIKFFANFYSVGRTLVLQPQEPCKEVKAQKIENIYSSVADFLNTLPEGTEGLSVFVQMQELLKAWIGSRSTITFCAKIAWFIDPDHWMMHDGLSRAGLKALDSSLTKTRIERDFQVCFAETFSPEHHEIAKNVLRDLLIDYPFPNRVIDKYLLLRGSADLTSNEPWISWLKWKATNYLQQNSEADFDSALRELAKLPGKHIVEL